MHRYHRNWETSTCIEIIGIDSNSEFTHFDNTSCPAEFHEIRTVDFIKIEKIQVAWISTELGASKITNTNWRIVLVPPPPPPRINVLEKLCLLNLHTSMLMMQLVQFWSHLVIFCSFISSICPLGHLFHLFTYAFLSRYLQNAALIFDILHYIFKYCSKPLFKAHWIVYLELRYSFNCFEICGTSWNSIWSKKFHGSTSDNIRLTFRVPWISTDLERHDPKFHKNQWNLVESQSSVKFHGIFSVEFVRDIHLYVFINTMHLLFILLHPFLLGSINHWMGDGVR